MRLANLLMLMSAPDERASMKAFVPDLAIVPNCAADQQLCVDEDENTYVVDKVSLGHTDTSIPNAKNLVLSVRSEANVEFLLAVEH